MDDELGFAETTQAPPRQCDECGRVDSLAFCVTDMVEGDQGEHLCFDCAGENGFCFGCGNFCAGMTSFDFSPIPGYCLNCVDQIRSTVHDSNDDDEYYDIMAW